MQQNDNDLLVKKQRRKTLEKKFFGKGINGGKHLQI